MAKVGKGFTVYSYRRMYELIGTSLAEDDQLRAEGKELKFYVREFADWREWGNSIEKELDAAGASYKKINW